MSSLDNALKTRGRVQLDAYVVYIKGLLDELARQLNELDSVDFKRVKNGPIVSVRFIGITTLTIQQADGSIYSVVRKDVNITPFEARDVEVEAEIHTSLLNDYGTMPIIKNVLSVDAFTGTLPRIARSEDWVLADKDDYMMGRYKSFSWRIETFPVESCDKRHVMNTKPPSVSIPENDPRL
jgi:hypothetical protein